MTISIDQNPDIWKKKLEELNLPWTNLIDKDKSIAGLYDVFVVPTMIIIDPEGKIIARNPENIKTFLNRLK